MKSSKAPPTFIAGLGQTPFSKASGVSELQLSLAAAEEAIADAGVALDQVDGLVTYDSDETEPYFLARGLGLTRLTFAAKSLWGGGGACGGFALAASAIQTGHASRVLVYRGFNGRSTTRYGQAESYGRELRERFPFTVDTGLLVPAHRFALAIHRHLSDRGIDNAALAPLCVQMRSYAATNPRAIFYQQPITEDDHQSSPWVAEPVLRRLDCCLETDAGAAFLVTGADSTRHASKLPVRITASAMGISPTTEAPGSGFFSRDASPLPDSEIVADQLWRLSGLSPDQMSAAILYDHFSPFLYLQLEAFGHCKKGQAVDFVRSGALELDGAIPTNPNGGQLGEGYIHGMNGVAEAVRQLRGEAANQVSDPEHVLVTGGPGIPTSGMILSADV